MSDNKIDIEAIKTLSLQVLTPKNLESTITYLNISKNKLGDEAIKILCQSLFSYKSLQKLDISKTDITNEGAKFVG